MAISTTVRASMVDAMHSALNKQYMDKLTYLDVQTSMSDPDVTVVKMMIEMQHVDALEIFRRLNTVLEVCLTNNVRGE